MSLYPERIVCLTEETTETIYLLGDLPAVRDGHIYEISSTCILQPGPAALTDGVQQLHAHLARAAGVRLL